mmetsp:Transcript_2578/g.3270  ORF Transcript_2578/g.3270 Transcript_2578/m.3270 type:complete len:155 (-) Transcript_2578:1496-1960(-)|eukprot:CAMPEP_0204850192 /NCGR_PEP_ID=MMETSP1347-20130617/7690_1 /ASSEMBLY_ACC=CAM_ASM_000690 /TAXON_ID=215587 /ORGANISM="Aplanochytrium stocchinoi, Strain GSBS06" /LENGTH=154 /DNA_ID=CAMNT_0051993027 /DNA_START=200 /DNA_END=664 /DNA_ORIENTATION=+
MSGLHGEMEKKFARFNQALSSIENEVAPFVSSPLGEIVPRLSSVENAKLSMAYSYSINALFYMYLKTQGVSPSDHPVKKDLERIKRYMAKTIAMDKTLKESAKKEDEAPTKRNETETKTETETVTENGVKKDKKRKSKSPPPKAKQKKPKKKRR